MKEIIEEIKQLASSLSNTTIMEVCGGHTNIIMRYGIRDLMPDNIKLLSGPGCPVCVNSQKDIDCMIELALNGKKILTYGDMMRVPGSKLSLEQTKSEGAEIIEILTATDALKHKDAIFFGIGFETTTPMTAFLLKNKITVYSTHKIMIPAMKEVIKQTKVDGFIDPGHVSTILGSNAWNELKVPQVISGFKPEAVLSSILKLLELIRDNKNEPYNNYDEVVKPEGNTKAKELINQTMKITDHEWRGFGIIPNSGLDPIDPKLDAKILFADLLKDVKSELNTGCKCADVIKGIIQPDKCLLFKRECTPETPKGACMVSEEGACSIFYNYSD